MMPLALPDDATVISIQKAVAANRAPPTHIRAYWNIPNDIFNGTVEGIYDGGSAILKVPKTDGKSKSR